MDGAMNNDSALPQAVKLIADFEGFTASPVLDIGGVWTQGYGFTFHPDGRRVVQADSPITEAQGMAWLGRLALAVLVRVRVMVDINLTDHEAAAVTSLAYNCGTGRIANSTLVRLLNQGRRAEAGAQFGVFVEVNGVRIPGLVRRRAAEAQLFAGDVRDTKVLALSDADRLNQAQIDKGKPA